MNNDVIHWLPSSFFLAPAVGSVRTVCGVYLYRPTADQASDRLRKVTCVHCRNAA